MEGQDPSPVSGAMLSESLVENLNVSTLNSQGVVTSVFSRDQQVQHSLKREQGGEETPMSPTSPQTDTYKCQCLNF